MGEETRRKSRERPEIDSGHCSICKDLLDNMRRFLEILATAQRDPGSEWLTVEQVARELNISRSIVYRFIRTGQLDAINIVAGNGKITQRGHYRISMASLRRYVEKKKVKLPPQKHEQVDAARSRLRVKVKNHLGL